MRGKFEAHESALTNTEINLIDEIADHLAKSSAVTNTHYSSVMAIGVLSAISGRGYRVRKPGLNLKIAGATEAQQQILAEDETPVVSQSVLLVGTSGSGLRSTLSSANHFLRLINPDFFIVSGFGNKEALWNLAQRYLPVEIAGDIEIAQLERLATAKPGGLGHTRASLQDQREWVVEKPFSSGKATGGPYGVASPVVTLATTKLERFVEGGLVDEDVINPHFHQFLMALEGEDKIKNYRQWEGHHPPMPEDALLAELRNIADRRVSAEAIYVDMSSDAQTRFAQYRGMTLLQGNGDAYCKQVMDTLLNVGALFAIGRNARQPIVEVRDLDRAVLFSWCGAEVARLRYGSEELSPLWFALLESVGS